MDASEPISVAVEGWWEFQHLSRGSREQRKALEGGSPASAWAGVRAIDEFILGGGPTACEVVAALVGGAKDDDEVALVGAGPLEDLLHTHGEALVDDVDRFARQDSRFRRALSAVWLGNGLSDATTERLARLGGSLSSEPGAVTAESGGRRRQNKGTLAGGYGWPMTAGQIERRLAQAGTSVKQISESHEKVRTSNERSADGTPGSAVLLVKWYPAGTGWIGQDTDAAGVWVKLVPKREVAAIRRALENKALPDLAAWLARAETAGEGWRALPHGRAWLWREHKLIPTDFPWKLS